jgi:nitrite reductase (NO-forming)
MTPPVPRRAEPVNAAVGHAPRRGAEVHAQTRRGLLVAAGFVVAALGVGAARVGASWWLPLHLFVVGGLLSAISAAAQMFAVTWSAAPASRPAIVRAQRWAVAAGAVALVVGRETDHTWTFVAGGATVIVAMLVLALILLRVRRQAVTDRFAPAIEAYIVAVVAGAVGMSLGVLLGAGRAGGRAVELRGAHLVLNVLGLVGLVIAATLPYFAATQVRSKMSKRATPIRMRVTFNALAAATAVAATGRSSIDPASSRPDWSPMRSGFS